MNWGTIISIAASITTVLTFGGNLYQYFAIKEKNEQIDKYKAIGISNAGTFSKGELMKEIVVSLENATETDAKDVYVVTDFSAYGGFSHHDLYNRYKQALITLATRAKKKGFSVRAVFYDKDMAKRAAESQFTTQMWTQLIKDPDFEARLKKWLSLSDVRSALLEGVYSTRSELDEVAKNPIAQLNWDQFVQSLVAYNEAQFKELRDKGIIVRRYPHPIPMHLWMWSEGSAIFSVANFSDVADEMGFNVHSSDVASVLRSMFNELFQHEHGDRSSEVALSDG